MNLDPPGTSKVSTFLRLRPMLLCCRLRELGCHRQRNFRELLLWLSSGIAVLCYRLAAVAPLQPLAWVLPYAVGAALKRQKKKKKERKKKKT